MLLCCLLRFGGVVSLGGLQGAGYGREVVGFACLVLFQFLY